MNVPLRDLWVPVPVEELEQMYANWKGTLVDIRALERVIKETTFALLKDRKWFDAMDTRIMVGRHALTQARKRFPKLTGRQSDVELAEGLAAMVLGAEIVGYEDSADPEAIYRLQSLAPFWDQLELVVAVNCEIKETRVITVEWSELGRPVRSGGKVVGPCRGETRRVIEGLPMMQYLAWGQQLTLDQSKLHAHPQLKLLVSRLYSIEHPDGQRGYGKVFRDQKKPKFVVVSSLTPHDLLDTLVWVRTMGPMFPRECQELLKNFGMNRWKLEEVPAPQVYALAREHGAKVAPPKPEAVMFSLLESLLIRKRESR